MQISDYIDNAESGRNIQLGLATSIIVGPLNPYIGVSAGFGVSLLTTYVNTQGKIVSATLKKSTKTTFKATIVYKYRQVDSNDGYYYISSIKII